LKINPTDTANILGLKQKIETNLDLYKAIEKGFPVSTVDHVRKRIAPKDPSFAFTIIPRATLARYKGTQRLLSSQQSDLVARIARIWTAACSVWKSEDGARRFLFEPHQLLEGKAPISMIRTEAGAIMVEDILGRIEHSSAV
jgi:putative toxin-antitoxin system antitoxin component (TIGR02293 family)